MFILFSTTSCDVATVSKDSASVTETSSKEKETVKKVKAGDKITTKNMEIKVKKIEFSYDVLPDKTSGMYTHYAADSGKVYIHIDTDVKNLQKQTLRCDEIMNVKADYNSGFTYDSFAVPEDSSTGFTYANITSIEPLASQGVRFLIECPQEVEETKKPLVLNFNVNGTKFEYKMR
jgi:hypothetical protein